MASFIVDTMDKIDDGVQTYAFTVFQSVGQPIYITLQACGVLALILIALNSVLNIKQVPISEYINWGIKYVIILSVATTWTYFRPIYEILTNVPGQYGSLLLQSTIFSGLADKNNTDLSINLAIDFFVSDVFTLANTFASRGGLFNLAATFIGIILRILAIVMVVIAIIVLATGKIGLAMAISFAPFFIGTLIFKQTSRLFETWTQFTLGFAMIPMVMAGIMGVLLGVADGLLLAEPNPDSLGDAAPFIVLLIAALVLLGQIPTMVQGVSGSVVAMASAATAQAGFNKMLGAAKGSFSATKGAVARTTAGAREAKIARDAGGDSKQIAQARWAGIRQNSPQRNSRREQVRLEALGGTSNYNPGKGPLSHKSGSKNNAASKSSAKPNQTPPQPPPKPSPKPKG